MSKAPARALARLVSWLTRRPGYLGHLPAWLTRRPTCPGPQLRLRAARLTFYSLTLALETISSRSQADSAHVSHSVDSPPISWTWSTIKPQPGAPRGYVQFERACEVCHGSGPAKPGTRALREKYHGKVPALLADRADLAPDYIKHIVRGGAYVMPPFRKTELSDGDLDEIVAYLTRRKR